MNLSLIETEIILKAVRSGGKGGQHVNKVSTKVELYFDIVASQGLSEEEKKIISEKLAARINSKGMLIVVSQEDRTQLGNKKIVFGKFRELLQQALRKRKKRKATKPTATSKESRIRQKKKRGELKSLRKTDWGNQD